jgi:hypothetical protein
MRIDIKVLLDRLPCGCWPLDGIITVFNPDCELHFLRTQLELWDTQKQKTQ